jgi:hypothetical protein
MQILEARDITKGRRDATRRGSGGASPYPSRAYRILPATTLNDEQRTPSTRTLNVHVLSRSMILNPVFTQRSVTALPRSSATSIRAAVSPISRRGVATEVIAGTTALAIS